ncbi:hypothetical protein VTO42DRAFT_3543 [Malbranchea cinnamomea]
MVSTALFLLAAAAGSARFAKAATPDEWRSRSIYQVLTDRFARGDGSTDAPCDTGARKYCGGNYRGLISQLDYIQGMGFDSVWISPITKQFEDDWNGAPYHGYWQTDLYALNEHFGTEEDLRALADELHARGMFLMVDVVINHNGWPGDAASIDYSQFNPFNSSDYYHPPCEINYDDQTSVEQCWLYTGANALPDLKTEDPHVSQVHNDWIADLVSKYSIDGLRIDTTKHVDKPAIGSFNDAAGVYAVGEVYHGDPAYTCPYQDWVDGVLNFPVYYPLIDAFKSPSGTMWSLVDNINKVFQTCNDPRLLGTFSENHDIPRFASYTQDLALAKNVLAFTILFDGIPIVYAGQEQQYSGDSDPYNREALWLSGFNTDAPLYKHIAACNRIRSHAVSNDDAYITTPTDIKYSDDHTLALVKGAVTTVLTNAGANAGETTVTVEATGYASGEQVTDVLSCESIAASDGGRLSVTLNQGLPRVFFPTDALAGSGLCEN